MSQERRPRIAVNGLLLTEKKDRLALDMRYSQAIWAAGGIPLAIPPLVEPGFLDALLDQVDGVLLTGGDDFDTERLGLGPTHPMASLTPTAKQEFDLDLCQRVLDRNLPVLGICYGMQLLGIVAGARLLQHLPEDRPGCQEHSGGVIHAVTLETGSKLAHIMGVKTVPVVSRHHQALDQIPNPWMVAARDKESLVEAIESRTHRLALGVQWHPEAPWSGFGADSSLKANNPHARLFEVLVLQASETMCG